MTDPLLIQKDGELHRNTDEENIIKDVILSIIFTYYYLKFLEIDFSSKV